MSLLIPPRLDEANTDLPIRALHWHVIWSKRGAEMAAADALYAEGYDVYVPMETIWNNRIPVNKPRETAERPLFKRYLFAACEEPSTWIGMCRVEGVERVMGKLGPVETMRLYQMKAEQARGDYDTTIDRTPKLVLEPGQMVEVNYEDRLLPAEIIAMSEEQRGEVLLIGFLGRNTKAQIAVDQVKAA